MGTFRVNTSPKMSPSTLHTPSVRPVVRMRKTPRASQVRLSLAKLTLVAGAWSAVGLFPASAATPNEKALQRWQSTLDAFAAADRLKAPIPGGVLFVGSSSIRLWDGLETAFGPAARIIKRGFGGSRLSDCASLASALITPYKPRLVVVYAGDNDLAEGASPQDVLASFDLLVKQVRETLPDTRIAYVSIKPSPSRQALMPQIREANALIKQRVDAIDNLDYIDIFSVMLDAQGNVRPELFREDSLHLNATGYALWRSVITGHLPEAAQALPTPATTPSGAVAPSDRVVVPAVDPAKR